MLSSQVSRMAYRAERRAKAAPSHDLQDRYERLGRELRAISEELRMIEHELQRNG